MGSQSLAEPAGIDFISDSAASVAVVSHLSDSGADTCREAARSIASAASAPRHRASRRHMATASAFSSSSQCMPSSMGSRAACSEPDRTGRSAGDDDGASGLCRTRLRR